MTIKQIRSNNSSLPLRLKIASGYILLIVLLGMIVFVVWNGKQQVISLNAAERIVQEKRITVNRTFEQLLGLSFSDDLLLSGDTAALASYRAKRLEAVATLYKLKTYYPAFEQQARIDSVCMLLEEKELHLCKVLETLSAQDETEELIRRRIPYLASQVEREDAPETKKKGGFLGLFRKKQKDTTAPPTAKTSAMLYSFGREVEAMQQKQQAQLAAYADSLRQRNIQLNGKLSRIICDFEADAMQKMEREHKKIMEQRECSLRLISLTAVLAVLLVIVFYLFIHRDITQKYNYRRRLEASDREKDELLAARKNMLLTVSHDLRAPLAAINGYAELLPDEWRKENRLRYVEAILQSSGRMLSLLNTLLDYYRLDTGKEHPDSRPFRLQNLTDALAAEYAPLAAKKRLELTTRYDGEDVVVAGDRTRILQIAGNLLSNAVKFTRTGYIRLLLEYRSGELLLRVEDTGAGMTEEQTRRIFEPFERLGNADTEEGFGLGLSITLALVELLKGRIEVQSHPGTGTTFTVRLPLPVYDEESLLPQPTEPDVLPADLRVVVVDNDAVLLAMTVEMFSRCQIHAEGCHSARELMECLRTQRYDLVLTDIMMPDVNGFGLLELLRTSNIPSAKRVPVVAMTARVERNCEEFLRAGFAGCLYKPFSRGELFATVQQCIENRTGEPLPEADFSGLFSGERNDEEMLALVARETKRNMTALADALEREDRENIAGLIHQLLPLWEVLRIDAPLQELQKAFSVSGRIDDAVRRAVREVLAAGKRLTEQAQRRKKGYG